MLSLIYCQKQNNAGIPQKGDTAIKGVDKIMEYFHLLAREVKFGELSNIFVIRPSLVATSKINGFEGE